MKDKIIALETAMRECDHNGAKGYPVEKVVELRSAACDVRDAFFAMGERIEMSREIEKRNLLSWALVEALAKHIPDTQEFEEFVKPDQIKGEGTYLTVTLLVNGRVIPVRWLFTEWEEQVEKMIEDKAVQMVEKSLRNALNAIDDLGDRAVKLLCTGGDE